MGDNTTSDVKALTARLDLLEAERAVLHTLNRYGHAIDYGLEADWVDCFLPTGAYDLRFREKPKAYNPLQGTPTERGARHVGHAQIAAFVANHTRAPGRWHKHVLVEPMITVTGDTARVQSYFLRVDHEDEGKAAIRSFGRYLDRMRRCADGQWRFEEGVAEIESTLFR